MKKLIITIDAEGDNLWDWHESKKIETENVMFLQRFQALCNQYEFKPVWLSNWEMIQDKRYLDFLNSNLGKCEAGIHIHAWNTPPFYKLPKGSKYGAPYLIEYPSEVIEEKIDNITREFHKVFGFSPISHRAGRWAINNEMFAILYRHGYKIDCSITPGIDWRKSIGQTPGSKGPDYRNEICETSYRNDIFEVPLTTYELTCKECTKRKMNKDSAPIKCMAKCLLNRKCMLTLRPNGKNLDKMLWLAEQQARSDSGYIMFMLHSSELMPGGSPVFNSADKIEKLYEDLEVLFSSLVKEYEGCTLQEYYLQEKKKNENP